MFVVKYIQKLVSNIKSTRYFEFIVSLVKKNKALVLGLPIGVVLVDIFFIPESYDSVIFGTLLIYLLAVKLLKIESRRTFIFCLVLLGLMFVSYLRSGTSIPTEKAAVWLVLFLALGIFQQWRE